MKQWLLEVAVLLEQAFELVVLVVRVAAYERERGGQDGQAAGEHDQVVADVEAYLDLLASLGLGLALLLADPLGEPEAEAVYGQAEDHREYVEDGVAAHQLHARTHAAERVQDEARARAEYGQEDKGDEDAHYHHYFTVRTVFEHFSDFKFKKIKNNKKIDSF